MNDGQSIHKLIVRFRARLRFGAAVERGLSMLPWGGFAALLLMVAAKLCGLRFGIAAFSFTALPIAFLAGAIAGWRRSFCSPYFAAKQLDQRLGLRDRLANAYHLLAQDPQRLTPLAALAVEDGLNAARGVKLNATAIRWSRRATYGLVLTFLSAGCLWMLYPSKNVPADQAVAVEKQNEMLQMIQGLQNLPGISAEQHDEIKKMLETMNISEDEMKKMTSADLLRLINAKGIEYKGGGGAKAFEAMKNVLADLEEIRRQHEEFERKNKEAYQFVLADGQKVTGVRIATQAPNEQIVRDRMQRAMGIKTAAESEELEQLQRQTELSAANSKSARGKVGLKNNSAVIDSSALLSTDEKYRKDRDSAIDDPRSEAATRVKKANQDLLNREIEKGDIPPATADKLKNWIRLESGQTGPRP